MKVTGLYVWSTSVEVEVPDDATSECQRMKLDEAVEEQLPAGIKLRELMLHECSNENLID